jgi:hypothetical protein
MRKINKMDVLRLVLVLALVAGIGLAFGAVGRFVPTHKIVQPVYCGSCHPEQVAELSATTHLGKFSEEIEDWTMNANGTAPGNVRESAYPNARIISGGCVMCHNFWENMKWYGVRNFALEAYDSDNPSITQLEPPTDIYGNEVSPYGLGSTKQYYMNATLVKSNPTLNIGVDLSVEPWQAGLNNYSYTDSLGTHSRLDYVWSALSAKSPGPIGFVRVNSSTGARSSCAGGTVEHGLCHMAASAVVLAYTDKKNEVMDFPDDNSSSTGFTGSTSRTGKGIFFTHEMAFTTAQYAAKPVKICGACHVLKLPPMQWGGEPWAIAEIKAFSAGVDPADPFGFRPTYNDLVAVAGEDMQVEKNYLESIGRAENTLTLPVAFRTPDWAHANVPCIRCHVHAGINGEMVSDNAGE